MWKRLSAVCLGLAVAGSMACVGDDIDDETGDIDQSALNITTAYDNNAEVEGFKYKIQPVECSTDGDNSATSTSSGDDELGETHTEIKSLKEVMLPGGFEKFEDRPFDADSHHQFADYLKLVDAGCYDVSVVPVDKYDKPIETCTKATQQAVPVYPGEMTEITLISQCEGAEKGLLDVVAAINTAPSLVDFKIIDNKFSACDKDEKKTEVKVCAVAEDPEKDPMYFKWEPEPKDISVKTELGESQYGECATYKLGESVQDYKLTVFDKFIDEYGNPVRAETWYKNSEDYPSPGDDKPLIESRAEQYYDLHVSCEAKDETPKCPKDKKYWKDKKGDWPVSSPAKICGKSWYNIITKSIKSEMKSSDKAFYTLAQQYVTARLNYGNEVEVPNHVAARMFMARGLLKKCGAFILPPVQLLAHQLATKLENFNNGQYSDSDKCMPPNNIAE